MPTPNKGEKKKDFSSRCMGDSEANHTFPDEAQRYRFCQSQWKKKRNETMEKDRRFTESPEIEIRKDEDGNPTGIRGTAAVYNQGTIIRTYGGTFEEKIAPGAFDEVLKQKQDIRGLFNHDENFPLGRVSAGTMMVRSTDKGLEYDIPILPRARADVLEAVQRRDITGNSFSFVVENEEDEEWIKREEKKQIPLRIVKRIARVPDLGPVTFPAYDQTEVSARVEARCKEAIEPEPNGFKRLQENRRRRLRLDGKSE